MTQRAVSTGDPRPHVVVVGGGFAGLCAARTLAKAPVRVTLVDRRNHHLFQPLLYQVATAALNPSDIAAPIRALLRRQANATVLLAEAVAVRPATRTLVLEEGELAYDHLILAAGATHSYFGHDDWAPFAPGLKTLEDALEMRRRILLAYERAEREDAPAAREAWLCFVVVGAGPTGVELAGALAEIARHALPGDFRRIDPRRARIVLLEGAPRVLPPFPEPLSEKARMQLEKLGVEVRTNANVTALDADGVTIGTERLSAKTVLWAAGVAASPLARSLDVPLDRAGRVQVTPELNAPGYPEIHVVGDLASVTQDGRRIPGVAPAAMQMGRQAARNVARAVLGLPPEPFRYQDKGALATIGRGAAVAAFSRSSYSGYLAWWIWLGVHIFFLIGFRNRLLVLFQWAWAYWTLRRGARLITGGPRGTTP